MESTESHSSSGVMATRTMKAAQQTAYGRADAVISVRDVPIPQPEPDQVLVQVASSSVNALDHHFLTGTPYFLRLQAGFTNPKRITPGADVAGTVVAIGESVTGFDLGDEVFGDIGSGGFAEYAVARAKHLAAKPATLDLEESATLGVAALTALQGLRDWAGMSPGDRVLINGASGGVGTFAVQIAKALGASHVTAVCSTPNVDIVRSIGADEVVDYTKDDSNSIAGGFDVFFDNAGSMTLGRSRAKLAPGGVMVMVTGKKGKWIRPVDRMLGGALRSRLWSQRFVSRTATASGEDGATLAALVDSGAVRPVIDRRFALDDAAAALAYQSEGHARGKSIVVPR